MIRKIFLFSLSIFLFSCGIRQDSHSKTILVDTLNVANNKKLIDSIDLDMADFITTNFPDTVRNVLYSTSDTLLDFINKSSILNYKKQKVLLGDTLSNHLKQNGFEIDNSEGKTVATKRLFNKRELISWFSSKSDTMTTQVIYWHLGKKYILIGQHWNH